MKWKMKQATKKRLKTSLFWSGMASALMIFAQSVCILFGYNIPQEVSVNIFATVNSLLGVLTFAGVLVNPEKVESFQAMTVKKK